METKQVAFGAAVIIASMGGAAVVSSPKTEQVYVAASEKADDQFVAMAAPLGNGEATLCERQWAYVDDLKEPTLGWMCGGAWLPAKEQAAMDARFGAEAVSVRLTYVPEGEGIKANAEVTTGPMPTEPAPLPPAVVAPPPPVVKAEPVPAEGELVP